MISWLSFGIALLKIGNAILGWFIRQQAVDEGRRQVILEVAMAIAAKVATRKQIQEHIDGLNDAQVDDELRDLEPR